MQSLLPTIKTMGKKVNWIVLLTHDDRLSVVGFFYRKKSDGASIKKVSDQDMQSSLVDGLHDNRFNSGVVGPQMNTSEDNEQHPHQPESITSALNAWASVVLVNAVIE